MTENHELDTKSLVVFDTLWGLAEGLWLFSRNLDNLGKDVYEVRFSTVGSTGP